MKVVLFSKLLIFLSFVGAFADNNNNNKTDTSFARLRGGSPEELHHEVVNSVAHQKSRELDVIDDLSSMSIRTALPDKDLCGKHILKNMPMTQSRRKLSIEHHLSSLTSHP